MGKGLKSMKDTFYFSHDYNTRNDIKIKRLIAKHNYLGYGLFWAIIEDLYNNANALPLDYECIAYDLRADIETIKSIINDFDLFTHEDGFFGSLSIQKRLDERNLKSIKARESALNRWNKSDRNANALPTQSDRNAIKESKGKESKGNDIKYKYTLFSQIKDLSDALNSFEGDKRYFFIAYKFWALWKHENPNHKTLINAKIDNWYNEVRKMVEIDKTSIDRILAVYAYFSKYEQKGFRRFWFDTIQSVAALRGKNKNGEYTLDKIAIEINAKTAEDTEFYQYIQSIIKKFNNNESLKSPKKAV